MTSFEEDKAKTITALAREQLAEEFGLQMSVDVGDAFFNALFYGTLKTFAERVDSNGFCLSSFGEEAGVRCYGRVHYPRDADSIARVLAMVGIVEPAVRILEFTLGHIPDGQYYIPHIYRSDGSVKANTVQLDTPAHTILALSRCVDLCGPTPRLAKLYEKLVDIVDGCWKHHFHTDIGLLDAGNYNEQLDTKATTCDLFTNCAMHAGYRELSKVAHVFGERATAQLSVARAVELGQGIERRLFDPHLQVYRTRYDVGAAVSDGNFNWLNLYCERWYAGRPQAWDNALRLLEDTTSIDWGEFHVVSGYPTCDSILGKAFGHVLGFMSRRGRFASLDHHLHFARATIRRPSNVYPEGWLYRHNPDPSDYETGFWRRFAGIWEAYCDRPEGDYTVDSGNAEQCAAFMLHFIEDLIGVTSHGDGARLFPGLPFGFDQIRVDNVPIAMRNDQLCVLSYGLNRHETGLALTLRRDGDIPVQLRLPVSGDVPRVQLVVDGSQSICRVDRQGEIGWVQALIPADRRTTSVHEVECSHSGGAS